MDELIARHEAAHAVVAVYYGLGVYGGIDIDTINPSGGIGFAKVRLFDIDLTHLSGKALEMAQGENTKEIRASLDIILAGPAYDAVFLGTSFQTALSDQPSDNDKAHEYLERVGVRGDEADALILRAGNEAVSHFADSHVGDAIEALGKRLLSVRRMDAATFQAEAERALREAHAQRAEAGTDAS